MPFRKGDPKPANSGRKKGGLNRETVRALLDSMGCDPHEGMARIAMKHEQTDPALAGRMYAELAAYVRPKLRAVEHSGPGGAPIQHDHDPYDELSRELARLAERERANGAAASSAA